MVSVKKLFASAALVVALGMTCGAGQAQAGSFDLTLNPLSITYSGGVFLAFGGWDGLTIASWVDELGVAGDPVVATASITWNDATSTGVVDVVDVEHGVQLLLANIITLSPLSMSGGGAAWEAYAKVASSTLDFIENVRIALASTDFDLDAGTAAADVTRVPEPATLTLTLAGFGLAAVRARRLRRG